MRFVGVRLSQQWEKSATGRRWVMIENLGIDGLVPPDDDDADIRDELVCAGREATFGFDTIGRFFTASGILRDRSFLPGQSGEAA